MLPQPEKASPAQPQEYSTEERRILLGIARAAIAEGLRGQRLELTAPSEHLAELRGAFTTLHLEGRLRGCVGYVFPIRPLYHTVAETAAAAAFADTRFIPVEEDELAALEIEISVLSAIRPIELEAIEIGRHGLLVSLGEQRGLLLPQVALEYGWDVETLLGETCQKAGLPMDAWRRGAVVQAFTAEMFGERDPSP